MSALDAPPWAQEGITDVAVARRFLADLRAPDTLVLTTNDADVAHPLTSASERLRGHGVTIAANVLAATAPPPELVAHHRSLGLGPRRHLCPRVTSARQTIAELVLADAALVARIRADASLARILVSFKSAAAARLIDALGLTPLLCRPPPAAYEAANDKLALARAGERYGFETLPAVAIDDEATLAASFRSLAARFGAGCIVRPSRGTSGLDVHHARTLRAARRLWRRLATAGRDVMLAPYVPPAHVRRNVAAHGILTADGFAPLAFTDQLVRRHHYRGGDATAPWTAPERAAVRSGLAGVARWLRDLGYDDAPLGVDGFLVGTASHPRFLVLDPNARLSATTMPWAAFATLAERAGRSLAWRFEGFRLLGAPLSFDGMRRRLGSDLLVPDAVARGGILPTYLMQRSVGPLARIDLWALVLGHDAEHVARLRDRVRRLGLIAR